MSGHLHNGKFPKLLKQHMRLPYYQINAFSRQTFGGNPAGVCPLKAWLPDEVMQAIAKENDLSETAFFLTTEEAGAFPLRWFTPKVEIDLCGHATLATAFLLFTGLGCAAQDLSFSTRSGILKAARRGEIVELDFPSRRAKSCPAPDGLASGLGKAPGEVLKARDVMAVFATQDEVLALKPDFAELAKVDCLGVIATAPGKDCDFVSRFFAPRAGIPEDPVTGSAHCTLIPYWAERLGKTEMRARQLSERGGELQVRDCGDRVAMGGHCTVYLRGEIEVEA